MAIYSLNLGFISRSDGKSSVGFSAYIAGNSSEDARTGNSYNYAHKKDVAFSRILVPESAPSWAKEASTLWNHAEKFEDHMANVRFRCDWKDPVKQQKSTDARDKFLNSTQTAQTVMGALPLEFTLEEAESCAEEFLNKRFVARGLVVQYAIHWDKGNPHFHALITRRPIVNGEFSQRKDHEIVSRPEHNLTRKAWEVAANKHLALAGYDVRIDCRSNEERGSLFLSGAHEGYWAQRLAERGEYSRLVAHNESVRQKNIEILCENPEALIHEVSCRRTVFTRKHLEDEIVRRVGGDAHLFSVFKSKLDGIENPGIYAERENFIDTLNETVTRLTLKIVSNPELVTQIKNPLDNQELFTSTVYKTQEEKLTNLADILNNRSSKLLSTDLISKNIRSRAQELGFTFSEEQTQAIHHLCSGSDIRILNGRAGTGKTTLLKAVAQTYAQAGYRVSGTSFQGKAAEIMEKEIGISSKTLDSLFHAWDRHAYYKNLVENGKLWGKPYLYAFQKRQELELTRLNSKDVILVDEANMIGGRLWERFLSEVTDKGAKLLIIQDTSQIKSRDPGDYGRLFAERYGAAETRHVMRQRISWQKECSVLLNKGRIQDGLTQYQHKGHIHWHDTSYSMKESLVSAYLKDHNTHPSATRMVLAYRNKDVEAYNQMIRARLKNQGRLTNSFSVHSQEFAVDDRVRFTHNDHHGIYVKNLHDSFFQAIKERFNPTLSLGVKNGTLGTILSQKRDTLTIRLDDGRSVKFNTSEYTHLTHGYAMSIHKSEGSTFDRSFVALDPLLDSSTLLVAMTRHTTHVEAFVSRDEIIDFKALVERISQGRSRETLQDYEVSLDQKPYLERVQTYRELLSESIARREEIEASLRPDKSFSTHKDYEGYQVCLDQKKALAQEILNEWDAHKNFTRLAGLRRDVLETQVGARPRMLSDLEYRASIQAQGYQEITHKTRDLWNTMTKTHPSVLAKHHTLYEDYQNLKAERDSLAYTFSENLPLYRSFLRIIRDESGVLRDYWGHEARPKDRFLLSSLKPHGLSHEKVALEKSFEERLPSQEKELYGNLKPYTALTSEVAGIWRLLKEGNTKSFVPEELRHLLKEKTDLRDALALKIVNDSEGSSNLYTHFKMHEEKLLSHAQAGELRELARHYQAEKSPELRNQYAKTILSVVENAENFDCQRILKQEGIELTRVKFDIVYAAKLKSGEFSKDHSAEFVFNHIQDYTKACQNIGKSWMQDRRNGKPGSWEETLCLRKDAATRLMDCSPALSLFKTLYPQNIEKLGNHACRTKNLETNPHSILSRKFLKAEEVLEYTRGRTRELAVDLLGKPNIHLSSQGTLRFGSKGKISVQTSGTKEGLWHDFSNGEGGNILALVAREKGLDFKEALNYTAWFLGLRQDQILPQQKRSSYALNVRQVHEQQEVAKEVKNRLESVNILHSKSQLTLGTIAETYLIQERGIHGRIPEDVRFLWKGTEFTYKGESKMLTHDCLAVFGRDKEGELSSIQLTKLNAEGVRAHSREGEKFPKLQYGIAKGSFTTIQQDVSESGRVLIAEGLETALSIREAGVEGKIVASFGIHNIKNYDGPEKIVILCADNDGPHARTNAVIEHARNHFDSKNKETFIVRPLTEGHDFNDVLRSSTLKDKGAQAIGMLIQKQISEDLQHKEVQVSHSKQKQYSFER